MTTKYWQARAYWAELRSAALAESLQKIIDGDPAGGTLSGSQCVEIAQEALAKDDDPEPRFELEE